MRRALLLAIAVVVLVSSGFTGTTNRTYGKTPKIKKETSISTLQAKPMKYKNKSVLLAGRVVDVCQHAGCWVEIEQDDGSRIICKSIGDVVTFPKDVMGREIRLQGKVMYDERAPGHVTEKHENGEEHACPAPAIMISIEGATVMDMAEAVPAAPSSEIKE